MEKQKKTKPTQAAAEQQSLGQEVAPAPAAATDNDSQLDASEEHHLLYKGSAGQMAVMAEFLYRLINVAVPEVDVGDDIFVVREKDEAVTRVQVKYSKADEQQKGSYVTQFNLPWDQFDRPNDTPALVYVLAVRFQDHWTDFIVIRRSVLRQLQADHDIGTVIKNAAGDPVALRLRLVFKLNEVAAKSGFSLQAYRDAFKPWPPAQLDEHAGESPAGGSANNH